MSVELHLEAVSKTFAPTRRVLNDITLRVAPGECLALLGPSGCGKTTLLRIIAGLEQSTSGLIHLDRQCVNDVPSHRRGVSMLFQRPALLAQKTVRHNLHWAWSLREPWTLFFGMNRQRNEELLRVARLLDLDKDLDRPVQQLSGGQQQRVALGRCLLRKAKLWLLDEPLGHLDAPLRTELRRQIRSLAQEFQVTTIHVTHDPEEALSVGDRVAVMQDGLLVQVDEPAKMKRVPASRFVAELVHHASGGLNVLAGQICREGMDTYFENAFGRWPISVQVVQDLRESLYLGDNFHASDGKVHIMMGIAVSDVRCGSARSAVVDEVGVDLAVQRQECSVSGTTVIAADARGRWIGRTGVEESLRQDQAVTMVFSMRQAYWFHSVTGQTLVGRT